MTIRELPFSELGRLQGTELDMAIGLFRPETTRILVVEDDDGAIIGCWSLLSVLHVEGFWIREDHRKRGGVARALLSTMQQWIAAEGAEAVVTASVDPEITEYLARLGASAIPGQAYFWPMRVQ